MADPARTVDDGAVTTLIVDVATAALVLTLAVLVGLRALGRVRRFAVRTQDRIDLLRPRLLPPGPRRDAALLRRRLREELACTRAMLAAAPEGLVFRADARELLGELAASAASLDADLAALERFADPVQLRAGLAVVAPQARQWIETSYSARQTLLRTAAEDRDRELGRLADRVAQQAAAAAAYRHGGRGLSI